MTRQEAETILNAKIVKNDEFQYLLDKLNTMPEESISDCPNWYELRNTIEMYKPKRTKKQPTKQTYYRITNIDRVTEKAYGIVTGSNNHVGSGYKEFIEWIPASQTKEINKEIYIPVWIIAKNNLWNFVEMNSKITL